MKNLCHGFVLLISVLFTYNLQAQDIYPVSQGELIFSWTDLSFTPSFTNSYPLAKINSQPLRYTMAFNYGVMINIDFSDGFGIYSGGNFRNIGMISDEVLPAVASPANEDDYTNYKVIRRLYTIGIPLALKAGSMKNDFYIYAGGEVEYGFHMKEKWWNSHDRNGTQSKNTEWFSDNTENFQPSVFGGIQFPMGLNLRYRYYFNSMLDGNYQGSGNATDVSNLSRYGSSNIMYVAAVWQIKMKDHNSKYCKTKYHGVPGEAK